MSNMSNMSKKFTNPSEIYEYVAEKIEKARVEGAGKSEKFTIGLTPSEFEELYHLLGYLTKWLSNIDAALLTKSVPGEQPVERLFDDFFITGSDAQKT